MSEGALHQHRFEAIEAFLTGSMSAGDRERFEAEMAHDAVLRAEVELQRENMLAVELGGFRDAMRTIAAQEQRSTAPAHAPWRTFLRYAAVVALVASMIVWWYRRPAADERLFAEHFVADPGLPVPMSISNDPVFHDAMVAYKLGDYDEARSKWATLLPSRPANDTLRYYLGSAALADGRPGEAVPMLAMVAADSGSVFMPKARWYLLLAYLASGDHARMDSLSLDDDPVYGERARSIRDRSLR